ncbi:MAG: Arabinose 5-phosphate isomerase KdsD [Candidatus Accumulibacter regalis]|jgi:arabinose-5-phosphate isomerase|uniref:Arabinose 5-phosphate isomerase KdsD n=1 Tax=Accumulibacter regalis TaxID=522306 RepID=A0A011PCG8_ACCRE|nr:MULTISPECIES: KpsF/GutQ family sugar-phosphate isomerase [unclassified Candidatus Accumulibacter]EXI85286.1 MAG: Arabinose 5-phosphate isomerase KdsD [Candidatus Accumulibacter regalis]MQM33421.1 KpsF/GutQ family sugar-phosphate isomerase [Candidatus Accumulibacter phosphatis]MBL8366461.1 KpsF/GutQ family sugar-phosphate isomerase [Accumulibacter sp.]MBN8514072.1 KpsF/GutQ family sugar-phosphate isomerase [Accumulibacter sp.]MBO3703982.1 KpsF/GutQ family sugar-phosphate isomerase [Accumulib
MNQTLPSAKALDLARQVLRIEADAVMALAGRIDGAFVQALALILNCRGRVIVSGMGKSGHVGRKIASTLSSTGTPAYFVHPAEASHGDLGMITRDDALIAISNSGESAELLMIVPIIKRLGAKLISITGNRHSALAVEADVHLDAAVALEACPLNLAPTASTTAVLALGDALAVALLDSRGFGAEDFARSHPGGSLGRRLLTHVRDVMRTGTALAEVASATSVPDAILEISRGGIGMTAVVTPERRVIGVVTDGDLRRAFARGVDLRSLSVADIMGRKPHSIGPDHLAVEAVQMMEQYKINQLPVVDEDGILLGALNMHDLFQAKVI